MSCASEACCTRGPLMEHEALELGRQLNGRARGTHSEWFFNDISSQGSFFGC